MLFASDLWQVVGIAGSRWLHLLAGITWIGLLYYFNFVQTPAFAQFEAPSRIDAQRKLLPRALWWFRMAAALTFVTGLMILGFQKQMNGTYFKTFSGLSIYAGALMATVMLCNVWFVIWPNQKIVIANAEGVAAGKDPDPAAAPAGRKGALASRTNTLFSIPVMWFMIGTSHFVGISARFAAIPSANRRLVWFLGVLIVTAVVEANCLGLLGGYAPGPTRKFLDDHKTTIIAGFILWACFFVVQLLMTAKL